MWQKSLWKRNIEIAFFVHSGATYEAMSCHHGVSINRIKSICREVAFTIKFNTPRKNIVAQKTSSNNARAKCPRCGREFNIAGTSPVA